MNNYIEFVLTLHGPSLWFLKGPIQHRGILRFSSNMASLILPFLFIVQVIPFQFDRAWGTWWVVGDKSGN